MKKIALFIIGFSILLPVTASAQIDSRCFARSDCLKAASSITSIVEDSNSNPEDSFYADEPDSICPETIMSAESGAFEEAGFCAAGGVAQLKVKIGGQDKFPNLPVFIAYLYRYSMTIGTALALLMIIVAGFEWVVAAGDSTKITAARKRVTNSIIGLVILVTSYTILRTINPALVQLRLPAVWMIRAESIAEPICRDIENKQTLLQPTTADNGTQLPVPTSREAWENNAAKPDDASCEKNYYINGAGGQFCEGRYCAPQNGQAFSCQTDANNLRRCIPGNLAGKIYSTNLLEFPGGALATSIKLAIGMEGWIWEWLDSYYHNQISVYRVCKDGKYEEMPQVLNNLLGYKDEENRTINYSISLNSGPNGLDRPGACGSLDEVKGYGLMLNLRELHPSNDNLAVNGATCVASIGFSTESCAGFFTDIVGVHHTNRHLIGKGGQDLAPLGGAGGNFLSDQNVPRDVSECILKNADQNLFVSAEELSLGHSIDVIVNQIYDVDKFNEIEENQDLYANFARQYGSVCIDEYISGETTVTEVTETEAQRNAAVGGSGPR